MSTTAATTTRATRSVRPGRTARPSVPTVVNVTIGGIAALVVAAVLLVGSALSVGDGSMPESGAGGSEAAEVSLGSALLGAAERQAFGHAFP